MNSRQLQYAVILAEHRNFSRAAQELKISQPAFSKQIISLENELGLKLFERGTVPLSLTPAGEFFIEKAKKLLFEEEKLLKILEDYKAGETGKLTIGVAPFRSLYLMPELVKKIKERFPKLQLVLEEHGLEELQKGLLEGLYDFAIMNLPVDESEFEVVPLAADEIVLVIPNGLLPLIDAKNGDAVTLADCGKIPFVVVGKNQEMRKLFDSLCAKANVQPEIFVEVTGVTTAREMVREGVAATLLPRQFLQREEKNENITFFELEQTEYSRQPAVVLRRGQYVSKYAEFAIEVLKKG